MTNHLLTGKNLFIALLSGIFFMLISDPAFALNVEKIGKGVVGNNREKMQMLANIFLFTGGFFFVLGGVVMAFMKNKFALQKRSDTSNATGAFLMVFGVIFMLLSLAF